MTIAALVVGTVNVNDSGAAISATTASGTTSASGSSFLQVWLQRGGTTPITATDSKSNTYSSVGSTVSVPSGSTITIDYFLATNGTGGASHTATGTLSAGTGDWLGALIEITGGLTSGLVDAAGRSSATGTSSPTWSPGGITLSSGNTANGELIVATCANITGSTQVAWLADNGFTIAASSIYGAGFPHSISGVIAYKVVSAAGTYNVNFDDQSAASADYAARVEAFIGAAGGGGSATYQPMQYQRKTLYFI